jgi:anti-sigma regulatory factor (Ser/Thr protein kinase)
VVAVNLDSPTIRLELESRYESVTLVRSMLAGVADLLPFDSELLDDLKTAVSEACNNVVLHAYGDASGPMVVELCVTDGGIEALVRDSGSGIQQVASSAEDRIGVGLAVISALADRAEFRSVPEGGTEVRMTFTRPGTAVHLLDGPPTSPTERSSGLAGDVVVTIYSLSLLGTVLGRITRAVAAGARFSLDRFSDVYLVTDALAAHARRAIDGAQIGFAIAASTRRLELTLGPLVRGSSTQLVGRAHSQLGSEPLSLLADGLEVEPIGETEMLRVLLLDRRAGFAAAG